MTKKCKFCGRTYEGPPNSFACPRTKCQKRRKREWQGKRRVTLSTDEPRTCIHCKEMFILKNRKANRRKFCYKPKCEEKNKTWQHEKKKLVTKGRLCNLCHKPTENGYINHPTCVEKVGQRVDGDFKYCSVEDILDMEI